MIFAAFRIRDGTDNNMPDRRILARAIGTP
jgi:hypothetical protein